MILSLLATLMLHGGDDRMDLIYFWSSILIVALPLTIFITLTYLLTKGYFRNLREKGEGSGT
jgi:hypothetical protein